MQASRRPNQRKFELAINRKGHQGGTSETAVMTCGGPLGEVRTLSRHCRVPESGPVSDMQRRRIAPSARSSVMSTAMFATASKTTTTAVAPVVPRVFAFFMQAEQSIVVDRKSPGGINSPHGLILFDGVSDVPRPTGSERSENSRGDHVC
jgi:hypothetical protein